MNIKEVEARIKSLHYVLSMNTVCIQRDVIAEELENLRAVFAEHCQRN